MAYLTDSFFFLNNQQKHIIGVTGYLGSGKTTVLKFLEGRGFHTIDADNIVHNLYETGQDGWRKIKDFFGDEFLVKNCEEVNRSKLGNVVLNYRKKYYEQSPA